MKNAISRFLSAIQISIEQQSFHKLTLSKPSATTAAKPDGLQNVYARLIHLKGVPNLQFTLRYKFKDVTKNLPAYDAISSIEIWLYDIFSTANLHTADLIYTLENKRDEWYYNQSKNRNIVAAAQTNIQQNAHDKQKKRYLNNTNAIWLQKIGVTNLKGEILTPMQAKYKQMDKYLEVVADILKSISDIDKADFTAIDMGAGKGYLTFALYAYYLDYLAQQNSDTAIQITGIEQRPDLVAKCNEIAQAADFQGLKFIENTIENYNIDTKIDLLIALHACDTATDDAIYKGILASANAIMVAPCCHKQVRRDLTVPPDLQPLLRHGILQERQAEMLTDAIRALILEANSYTVKVFEFISLEHTGKNVMITAVKKQKNISETEKQRILVQVTALKTQFGIAKHYLEDLMSK